MLSFTMGFSKCIVVDLPSAPYGDDEPTEAASGDSSNKRKRNSRFTGGQSIRIIVEFAELVGCNCVFLQRLKHL